MSLLTTPARQVADVDRRLLNALRARADIGAAITLHLAAINALLADDDVCTELIDGLLEMRQVAAAARL